MGSRDWFRQQEREREFMFRCVCVCARRRVFVLEGGSGRIRCPINFLWQRPYNDLQQQRFKLDSRGGDSNQLVPEYF